MINIKVAKVIRVNKSFFAGGSEDVIIKDTEGRTWAIPEDAISVKSLKTRYDIKTGMELRLKIAKKEGEQEIAKVSFNFKRVG